MKNKVKEKIYPSWMCVPALGIYTLFYIVPIAAAFFFSFTDWNMDRMNAPKFAGLRNFINLFGDEVFLRSAGNTMLFAVMTTVLKLAVGLALALLVVQKFKGNGFFRTLFYLPCVLSCMIIGLLFTGILKMDGLLNNALRAVGMESMICDWLGKYGTAMFWIIFIEVWMWAGFNMFLFISGLQSIPAELYESAQMDGASAWDGFGKMTLPVRAPAGSVGSPGTSTGGGKGFGLG